MWRKLTSFRFQDARIQHKLSVVIVATSMAVLALTCATFVTYEFFAFRRATSRNLLSLAQVISANSTAALGFQDEKTAREILSTLAVEDQIAAAALYLQNGKLFATYPVTGTDFPQDVTIRGPIFEDGHLVLAIPVSEGGRTLGTLYMRMGLRVLWVRVAGFAVLVSFVMAASIALSILLARKLQRSISEPVLELARTARLVSREKNYTARARKFGSDELAELTENFNEMLHQVQQHQCALGEAKEIAESASQAKDHFLATLSHELRTPLTPVLAVVSNLCSEQDLPADVLEQLEIVRRNTELEARLIDDLLDLTRVVRGKLELRRAVVDLHELVQHAIDTCYHRKEGVRPLYIATHLDAASHLVHAEASRLTQILWNLLNNAIKFSRDHGTITITSRNDPAAGTVSVAIADEGVGIPSEVLPRIFNAFEQGARETTRQFGGLGLGLSISKALADLHGGNLIAESDGPDQGAVFTLTLPVTTVAAASPPLRPTSVPQPAAGNGIHPDGKLKILLVEDHADTALVLQRLLKSRGYLVSHAPRVEDAVATFSGGHFDLLISDLGLPDGTGLDLMKSVQAIRPVPAIALSGFGMEDDTARSKAAGFAVHLTKPVDVDLLVEKIQGLTADRNQPNSISPR